MEFIKLLLYSLISINIILHYYTKSLCKKTVHHGTVLKQLTNISHDLIPCPLAVFTQDLVHFAYGHVLLKCLQ
ncbi:hypothetical protein XELAEV_18010333mg [Xenopus laevis]|uniref:Uncharacterized protein n=1 Tax=Xenopus laevis TaxID=8355 RepID=A0A974I1R0_XENLA|nr:hypothetical protein XELAEV_18010333mg [Xenopus laevis]